VDGLDRTEAPQFGEHRGGAEIARVDDQIRGTKDLDARLRQVAVAARQMRIRDQGESNGGRSRSAQRGAFDRPSRPFDPLF
jgi:hypothetical protein